MTAMEEETKGYLVLPMGGMWLQGLHRDHGDIVYLKSDEAKYPDLADSIIEIGEPDPNTDTTSDLILLGIF